MQEEGLRAGGGQGVQGRGVPPAPAKAGQNCRKKVSIFIIKTTLNNFKKVRQ